MIIMYVTQYSDYLFLICKICINAYLDCGENFTCVIPRKRALHTTKKKHNIQMSRSQTNPKKCAQHNFRRKSKLSFSISNKYMA